MPSAPLSACPRLFGWAWSVGCLGVREKHVGRSVISRVTSKVTFTMSAEIASALHHRTKSLFGRRTRCLPILFLRFTAPRSIQILKPQTLNTKPLRNPQALVPAFQWLLGLSESLPVSAPSKSLRIFHRFLLKIVPRQECL